MSLFTTVTADEMQAARVVTGMTMALLLATGFVPALRAYAFRIRLALLLIYLLACGIFIGYVLLR